MQQYEQKAPKLTPDQIAAMMVVPTPFVKKEAAPYDGPTGPFLLEIVKMGDPFPVKPEYQNEQGDRYRAAFDFEIVGDSNGNPDEAFGRMVDLSTGEIDPGHIITGFYNLSLHEKSKLRPLMDAAFGGRLNPKQRVIPEEIEGKRFVAMITLGTSETQSVTIKDPDTGRERNVPMTYANLSGFVPFDPNASKAPRGRAARATVAVVDEPSDPGIIGGEELPHDDPF